MGSEGVEPSLSGFKAKCFRKRDLYIPVDATIPRLQVGVIINYGTNGKENRISLFGPKPECNFASYQNE